MKRRTRLPCSVTDLSTDLLEKIRDRLPKSDWASARCVCKVRSLVHSISSPELLRFLKRWSGWLAWMQEWRQVFSRGLRKATLPKHGAGSMRLRHLHHLGQQVDVLPMFWLNALSSLAQSFIHITELDLQNWPLVSSQSALPDDLYQYFMLRALTLALPAMPALRTLRLSHYLTPSRPLASFLQQELPQAMESWPSLRLHLDLTLQPMDSFGRDNSACSAMRSAVVALRRLSSLASLAIKASIRTQTGGGDLERHIGAMTGLESLSLDLHLIVSQRDSNVICWSALTRLSQLSLLAAAQPPSSARMALLHLPSRLPCLQDLSLRVPLSRADLTTFIEGAAAATGLTRLEWLFVGGDVMDDSLWSLSRLPRLADLTMSRSRLTGEFMARIAPVAPLTRLALLMGDIQLVPSAAEVPPVFVEGSPGIKLAVLPCLSDVRG